MVKPSVLLIELSPQYSDVLSRKLRELNCEVHRLSLEEGPPAPPPGTECSFRNFQVTVLSGAPKNLSEAIETPAVQWLKAQLVETRDTPLLAIGRASLLIQLIFGGRIEKGSPLLGGGEVHKFRDHLILQNVPHKFWVWGSITDCISKLGHGFYSIATRDSKCMISAHVSRPICAISFNPELYESEFGTQLLRNFFSSIAKVELYSSRDIDITRSTQKLYEELESKYRNELKDSKVLVALSGGIDSSVLIHFLRELLPEDDIYPIYISTSLFPREKEAKLIRYFNDRFTNFQRLDWAEKIFEVLRGVVSPEEKRRLISLEFQKSFSNYLELNSEAGITHFVDASTQTVCKLRGHLKPQYSFLAQQNALSIRIIKPFSNLFKDQVRMLGKRFNLPPFLLAQQPFPSPGLAIRIAGEVTKEKVELLSKLHLFIENEFKHRRLERYSNQFFPILLDSRTISNRAGVSCVGATILLRAVETVDFVTAKVSQLPVNELVLISTKMIENFPEVSRVLYDLTTKPSGNVEWE